MCEPTTIAYGVGLALTAIGGVQSYRAQRAAADTAEEIGERNAALGRMRGEQERQTGNIEEEKHLRKVRQMLGAQRAQQAANGLDINSGSALDLQAETAGFGAADALNIRTNALRRAWGFEADAVNSLNSGRADAANYNNQATGTLITTGASLASQYRPGGFSSGAGGASAPGTKTLRYSNNRRSTAPYGFGG